ncbi:hypothetical protein PUN28_018250 [Cardiocondyla obscurior]|uniref:Uncharacterized protein n=1 Tax=Cardiocondyla obscurior TaxID=286306 RepID=A0AAW2EKF6_9HYME
MDRFNSTPKMPSPINPPYTESTHDRLIPSSSSEEVCWEYFEHIQGHDSFTQRALLLRKRHGTNSGHPQCLRKNLKEDWVTFVGREPLPDEHPERRRRPRMGILHRRSNPEDHL